MPWRGLDSRDLFDVVMLSQKVTPIDRAKYSLAEGGIFFVEQIPPTCCFRDLALVIIPNGDVFPCGCWSELSKSLNLRNAYEMSLKETVNSAKANYMVRILTQAGPGTFIPIIEKAGLLDKTNRRYTKCVICAIPCLKTITSLKSSKDILKKEKIRFTKT
jgi:Iron-sulfur cluster-binding domain